MSPLYPLFSAFIERRFYNEFMASDEYHEAILQRIHQLQREILELSHREAQSFAYIVSRDMPEEAIRMLLAELLLDYWAGSAVRPHAGKTG